MSTTTRILLCFLALFAVALGLLVQPLLGRVQRQYLEAAEEPMVDTAQLLASIIEQNVGTGGDLDLSTIRKALAAARARQFNAQIYSLAKTTINSNIYVTDRNGRVLFDSDDGRAEGQDYRGRRDVGLTLAGFYGARATRADPRESMTATLFVAAPIYQQGNIIGVVSVSKPQRSMLTFIDETRAQIRWLALLCFLCVALGAAIVTSVFSRPIRQLTEYARAVTRGERSTTPPLGAPEVIALGKAFEEMRDALEDRKYVQTYVQTLTHEMKSPLAAIRGAAELLQEDMPACRREKFLANIEAESQRLQKQIDRLLVLSAIESRKRLEQPGPIHLADLVRSVVAQAEPAAQMRGLSLQVICETRPIVRGEAFLIETALDNLLQNAIDFSPENGRVCLTVSEQGKSVQIAVEDEGPGIPAYALSKVFDRFYSLQHPSTGRKSSGLGLCFVREAAELHGGQAAVTNRSDVSGVRALLVLPLEG